MEFQLQHHLAVEQAEIKRKVLIEFEQPKRLKELEAEVESKKSDELHGGLIGNWQKRASNPPGAMSPPETRLLRTSGSCWRSFLEARHLSIRGRRPVDALARSWRVPRPFRGEDRGGTCSRRKRKQSGNGATSWLNCFQHPEAQCGKASVTVPASLFIRIASM